MGLALPAVIARGVYLAGLNGLQRQALANLLQTGGTTPRAVASVAALLLVAPTVRVFFVAQRAAYWPRRSSSAWRCGGAAHHRPRRPRALGRSARC